jgi:hypothetical protein
MAAQLTGDGRKNSGGHPSHSVSGCASWEGSFNVWRGIDRVLYPGYCRLSAMTQKSGYVCFPPVANGWGTKYPILDMAPPLLTEEDGSPT